jgi:hypothetical protein
MAQKQTIRRLSLLLVVGLVLQSVVILGFGEPWPSIALPRFSDPGGMGKTFTTETPELTVHFAGSTATRLSHHRFLGNLPRAFHSAIMEKNFRQVTIPYPQADSSEQSGAASEESSSSWIEELKGSIKRTFRSAPKVPAMTSGGKRWVQQRLEKLYPKRTPSRLEVEWYRTTRIRQGDRLREENRERTGRLIIRLDI